MLIGDDEIGGGDLLADLQRAFRVEKVRSIPRTNAMEYFVASPGSHQPDALNLYRVETK